MRSILSLVAACAFAISAVHAQDLAATCHASSSYDLTIRPDGLLFDRTDPRPRRIELHDGGLRSDGAVVPLNTEDRDRLALFERELRALVPKAREVATRGVDLAVDAVRAETAGLGLGADTRAELGHKLAARAGELKARIATSTSTHDWQGDLLDRYADDLTADLVPLLAQDLGQQAVAAALSGDLEAADALRDHAADLGSDLQPRLERRMQALRPQIQALCPALGRLYELQRDVRGAAGRPLALLQVGKD
ncbi:MAG: DUF2884 family protein [Lysobacterales bacterium]